MADQKISQLTDGGASQATDEYVIARSGANYRIDGASVAAAATSVGTLTSLTVSGDLTVDTSTLKVDSANNRVGIGTASPSTNLHVSGSGSVISLTETSTQYAITRMKNPTHSSDIGVDNTSMYLDSGGAYPIIFYTGSVSTERARITSGGYFKASNDGTYVGATGTYHELRQSAATGSGVYVSASSATFTGNLIYANTTKAANSDFVLATFRANDVEQFTVLGNGTLYAQNTTIQSLSDARLKDNVVDATDGLNVITALRPVRYDWKPGYGNDRTNQLGFIAQEVEAVFPEAVSAWAMDEPTGEVDGDGKPITEKVDYKTVGPGALIPVLVKAIQELEARIAVLEAGA